MFLKILFIKDSVKEVLNRTTEIWTFYEENATFRYQLNMFGYDFLEIDEMLYKS